MNYTYTHTFILISSFCFLKLLSKYSLGTRHCSYLHQQIIELLAYALVLSGNHVFTSGAGGTHSGKSMYALLGIIQVSS